MSNDTAKIWCLPIRDLCSFCGGSGRDISRPMRHMEIRNGRRQTACAPCRQCHGAGWVDKPKAESS